MDVLRSLAAGVGEADKRGMSLKSDIWKFRRNVAYPIGFHATDNRKRALGNAKKQEAP